MMTEIEHLKESQTIDFKSIRILKSNNGLRDLAQDCVCFANASGGQILIGIEDDADAPQSGQRIDLSEVERLEKRIRELSVNVQLVAEVSTTEDGDEYIRLRINRSTGVASTSDGRYLLRVGDQCQSLVGDDVLRLVNERPTQPWESMSTLNISRDRIDSEKLNALVSLLHRSDRVKQSVKEKLIDELLEHYGLADGQILTHLGILLIGNQVDRRKLGTSPVVQAIQYDAQGNKINKYIWDDYLLSPIEMVDAIWHEVSDFRQSYEIKEGLLRVTIPAYDETVIRELLVNALVHRPYTQRGDIFLNLHPDLLEVVNPGRLPLGVTPKNILHASRRRNDGLARIFHDVQLMEREGSGFDLMYDRLLTSGRNVPRVSEGTDSVHVVIERRILHPDIIRLIDIVDQRYQLTQRERIILGRLAQAEAMSAKEIIEELELKNDTSLKGWIARLEEWGIVKQLGRTKAARYFVEPKLLKGAGLDEITTLTRIQPHRLKALILEDLERYPISTRPDINRRIGNEIHPKMIVRAINELIDEGKVVAIGERRWRKYKLVSSNGQNQ